MAPFDSSYSSNLKNKLSPLIEGQVPDFIQADHAVFVTFLKHYYEIIENYNPDIIAIWVPRFDYQSYDDVYSIIKRNL